MADEVGEVGGHVKEEGKGRGFGVYMETDNVIDCTKAIEMLPKRRICQHRKTG